VIVTVFAVDKAWAAPIGHRWMVSENALDTTEPSDLKASSIAEWCNMKACTA
jgi:hypothetical protein